MPHTDTFRFHLDESFTKLTTTKRTILSVSARLFDPFRLLRPIGLTSKILLQSLWQLQLEWVESMALVTGSSHSNLPKIKLQKFSGKHSEYKQFIGIFVQLVDSDSSLSNIEKFNHC